MIKKIYLAIPYSHEDENVRIERFKIANLEAGLLMIEGHLVFSPISHTHPIALACKLPLGFDFWEQYDQSFIMWCDEVHVIRLPGWKSSKGVQREIKYAMSIGKKIIYQDPLAGA
jgi:hypothetical protein